MPIDFSVRLFALTTTVFVVQVTDLPFFATKVRIGRAGIEEIFPLGPLNHYER